MRVISYPKKVKKRGPRRPSWWLTWWMPVGTFVENDGVTWEKVVVGAADQAWREWVRSEPDNTYHEWNAKRLASLKPPAGPSGISRPGKKAS